MFGTRIFSGLSRPDFSLLPAATALALGLCMGAPQASQLPRLPLQVGTHPIIAEVAADNVSRSHGLMFRQALAPDHGMLFVFPEAGNVCFWMKNTPLPLSIAFIDPEGRIINLADMQPQSLDPHCANAPAQYALEMEQGWFKQNAVEPGVQVQGLPPAEDAR